MTRFRLLALLCTLVTYSVAAQETPGDGAYPGLETGKMWTFDVPPTDYWAKRYNFTPSQQWLDHARLSAVRYGTGCSASFVSGAGLVMTNHHCARACIESATKEGEDFLSDGFYAPRREDERPCQGLNLDQLQEITDVTAKVTGGVPVGAPPNRAADIRKAAIQGIEEECGRSAPEAFCQVVVMYRGGQYKLYRFRRFSDVRLVFAPESQMAFFGGDPDNFTYPRHDIDMSFVRAYENGTPAETEHYFRWSTAGSAEGDLVFVIGNPGSTGRLNAMAQLEFLRDVQYPVTLATYKRQIEVYKDLSAASEEYAKSLRNALFSLENSQKAVRGYQSGLLDPQLMAHKRQWERNFRARVQADPALRRQYGQAWTTIAVIRRQLAAIDKRRRYHAFGAYGSRLLGLAGLIVRQPVEMAKADSARLPAFQEANRALFERLMFSTTPVDTVVEARLLTAYFTAMASELPANDPVLNAALKGRSPGVAARELVRASTLISGEARKTLIDGGPAAIQASKDPFITFARTIDPLERAVQRQVQDLSNREAQADEQVARALLAVFGNTVAPDATFSLRISDGEVKPYPMNGTLAPSFTTFHGLYDRSKGFGGKAPWDLPRRWQARPDSLNLDVPLNAVSTSDIIGGNSGSPVINREGEIIGLIFDGNIESLPLRFLFSEERGRSVFVDSRGIIEALRRVYQARGLADELEGRVSATHP